MKNKTKKTDSASCGRNKETSLFLELLKDQGCERGASKCASVNCRRSDRRATRPGEELEKIR